VETMPRELRDGRFQDLLLALFAQVFAWHIHLLIGFLWLVVGGTPEQP
jgi:hypothetical protein